MSWLLLLAIPSVGLTLFSNASPSRRRLAALLVLLVPVAGAVLAAVVLRTRGGGVPAEPEPERPPRANYPDDIREFAEQPALVDRLIAGNSDDRLTALVALSSRGDDEAVAILRWIVDHAAPDAVLDAAVTLEEIALRGELVNVVSRTAPEPRRPRPANQVRDVAAAALLS